MPQRGGYSANIQGIRDSSRELDASVRGVEKVGADFDKEAALFDGCWGTEGVGDDFGDTMNARMRGEVEQFRGTIAEITNAYMGLLGALAREADPVQRPQIEAMEDISTLTA